MSLWRKLLAEFIGTMNRLPGEVRDGAFVTPAGRLPWSRGEAAQEVLFRPEDVAVVEPEAAQLTGTIAAAIFLGDRTRLAVAGLGPSHILVDTGGARSFTVGETIHLRLAESALLTL